MKPKRADIQTWVCLECSWVGDDPEEHQVREFDGLDCAPYRSSASLSCPDCGGEELEELGLCCQCGNAQATEPNGLCSNCFTESERLQATLESIALTPRKP